MHGSNNFENTTVKDALYNVHGASFVLYYPQKMQAFKSNNPLKQIKIV